MATTVRDTIKEITRKHLSEGKGKCYGQCLTAVGWVGGTLPEMYEEEGMVEFSMADVAGGAIATGIALAGGRPIYVVRYQGFQWYNLASIVNYAAKSKEIWGRPCPIFVRSIAMEGGIGTLTTETQFRSMGITGITGPVILSKPLSTISGTTLQSALYLFDGYTTGSTNSNILWFRPLTETTRRLIRSGGETYGSCVISNGNCIDYVNSNYCDTIGGTFFTGLTCDGNTYGKRGCCYWNINTGSYACIDARPKECQNFNGIIKNFPCSYYGVNESCLNICLPCDEP